MNPLVENTCISKFKIFSFFRFLRSIDIIATAIINYYDDAMESGRGRVCGCGIEGVAVLLFFQQKWGWKGTKIILEMGPKIFHSFWARGPHSRPNRTWSQRPDRTGELRLGPNAGTMRVAVTFTPPKVVKSPASPCSLSKRINFQKKRKLENACLVFSIPP